MGNKALIALAAINGLLHGIGTGRQKRFENQLKLKELESKSGENAQKNITDAMKNFMFFRNLKQGGTSPDELNAFGVFAKGADKYGFEMPGRGGGGGGGGKPGFAVRKPKAEGGGDAPKKPTHRFNPATGKVEPIQ